MGAPLALTPALRDGGGILLALLAAAAVLAPQARVRAGATLATLILAPALLVAQVWHTPQLAPVRHHPLLAAAAAVVGLGVLVLAAAALRRRPGAFAPLAVAALPFRIPVESGGTTSNLLVPLYLVVGVGALALVVPALRGADDDEERRRPSPVALALLGSVVLYAVQAVYSKDAENAVNQLVFFYVPFALLFGLLAGTRWTPRIAAWCFGTLAGVALVLVGIGYGEYASRRLLLNPKVLDTNQLTDYFRVNSLFFDPNIYGRFLALVMLAVATVLLWTRAARVGWACAVALAVLWGGLVLSFSQSSFVALLAGLAVLAALRWNPWRTAAAVLAVAVVGAAFVIAGQRFLELDLGSAKSVNRSTSGRLNLVKGGGRMFADRPIGGWGSGSFATVYRRRTRGSRQRAVSASHTIPVTVAAEQGVLGLLAYGAILATAFALLIRGARAGPLRAYVLAAFAALVLHTLAYASFLEDPATWTLLGIAVALPRPP
jgi:O-antigen ligase